MGHLNTIKFKHFYFGPVLQNLNQSKASPTPGHLYHKDLRLQWKREESEKCRHVSLGLGTTSRYAAVAFSDALLDPTSDATAGMRNTHGFPVLGTYPNLPVKGTLHPLWAPSSLSHSSS